MLGTTPIRKVAIQASLFVFIVVCVSPAGAQNSPGESAANGPFPGDVSLYERELAIAAQHTSPGYSPSLNAAEISASERSGYVPAASFTGSFDAPHVVYAWRSADRYQGLTYLCNRRPGELYLVGGDYPPNTWPMPPGPYIAKADATTGEQVWRTYVDNANVSGRWIGNANLSIMDDGNIPFAWSNQIVLIDGDTGQILKHGVLPAGQAPAIDVTYKHLTIAPGRTLILKRQTRPTGETSQGTMAIFKGLMKGLKQPNSHLWAGADPENNMIHSADMGVGTVAGIRIDPSTGTLDVAFVIDNATTTFQPVIGPKDRRVLLLTNAKKNNPSQPMKPVVFSGNYTEPLARRDGATGRLLAESDYFEPLTINLLTTPGFGGRVYFATVEDFVVLHPLPAKD